MGQYAENFFNKESEPKKDEYLLAAVYDLLMRAKCEWSACEDKSDSEAFLRKVRRMLGIREIHPYDKSWADMRQEISVFLQTNNLP